MDKSPKRGPKGLRTRDVAVSVVVAAILAALHELTRIFG